MSFIVTLYVPEGIVMAADSRLTMNLQMQMPDGNQMVQSFMASDSNHKLYLVADRFAIAFCGEAAINNVPLAGFINKFVEEKISSETDVTEIPRALIEFFNQVGNKPKITFHVAGYRLEGGVSIPYVYVGHINTGQVQRVNGTEGQVSYGCSWGGDSDIFARLMLPVKVRNAQGGYEDLPHHDVPYNFFTLQDAIDFAIYAIDTTIQTIRFKMRPKTVGGPVDVLMLKPGQTPEWIQKKTYHGA